MGQHSHVLDHVKFGRVHWLHVIFFYSHGLQRQRSTTTLENTGIFCCFRHLIGKHFFSPAEGSPSAQTQPMYIIPFVFTAIRRMGEGRDNKSKEHGGMAAKRTMVFSYSLGFYLWGPNQNWLVAYVCSQTAHCCAVADASLPTTTLFFFPWWFFMCRSDMASVTGASHSQPISMKQATELKLGQVISGACCSGLVSHRSDKTSFVPFHLSSPRSLCHRWFL